MSDHEQQQWDRALVGEGSLVDTDDDPSDDDDDANACLNDGTELGEWHDAEEESSQEKLSRQDRSQTGRPKRRRGDNEEEDAGDSEAPPMLQETGTGVACTTPRLVGNYGVVVPWLHQIGSSLQVLGNGRSGIVTRNLWSGQEVAVKKVILQEDDECSVYRVYEHECKVLLSLRSLWGTHVPKLLFRKPWTTSPMIGLQLGEQLADDMSTWEPEDRQKAIETISKVATLGWAQQDIRGGNFVRLRKGEKCWIAMIDFETVEKIK
jgi:hypothetical protein